ncbi:uncharacterized protein [Argopecten irradians]|uniref:uncharacterized protein n=1 Tax=Argopecten irradians TaxID=31199 RepID=UPI00371DA22C
MARNEEKQLGRLNRLLLKQEKEEQEKKNPRRPKLDDLNSSEAIKKWIPSIKRDIDFCLKQSQVPCYPESKIQECNSKIDSLRRQYWAFVRKLRQLDPSTGSIPWTDRHYTPKKRQHSPEHQDTGDESDEKQQCIAKASPEIISPVSGSDRSSQGSVTSTEQAKDDSVVNRANFSPISTPILDNDGAYQTLYGYEPVTHVLSDNIMNLPLNDQPLSFITRDTSVKQDSTNGVTLTDDNGLCQSDDDERRHLNDDAYKNGDFTRTTSDHTASSSLIPYSDSSDDND